MDCHPEVKKRFVVFPFVPVRPPCVKRFDPSVAQTNSREPIRPSRGWLAWSSSPTGASTPAIERPAQVNIPVCRSIDKNQVPDLDSRERKGKVQLDI
jgi:hypothetical protein